MATIGELTTLYNELVIKVNAIISNSKSINELTLQSPLVTTSEIPLNGGEKTNIQSIIDLLNVSSVILTNYNVKDANYTLTENDGTIECTANTFTLTLPTAVGIAGRVYVIKNTGSGIVTIDADGTETIDDELTQSISKYESLFLQSNGTNWVII